MSIHCQQQVGSITKVVCCLSIHPKDGVTVYYVSEVFTVKPEMQAGFFRNEGKHSKARYVAAAESLYPLSSVRG